MLLIVGTGIGYYVELMSASMMHVRMKFNLEW